MAPELRRKRSNREIIRTGDILRLEDLEFALIKCEPPEGVLDPNTDYYVDGEPVVNFNKIQFSAWGPEEESSDQLFSECITKHFKGEFAPYGTPGAARVHLFYCNQVIQI